MAQLFEEERRNIDNKAKRNLVFFGYPYQPPVALDDYRRVISELEREMPLRLWYFLDEVTTAELMRKIWRAILRADLAVFDTSGGNPNVAFELGLAVAENKSCIIMLKAGEANPLGSADLGYAERAEYQSVATLKEKLRSLLQAKSSALRLLRDVSFSIHDASIALSREEVEAALLRVVQKVFTTRRLTKGEAEELCGDRRLADIALNKLRDNDVLKIEGQKRGAHWVFTDSWVHIDHEVSGS